MSKLKCIVVDDEPLARRVIKNYISDLDELEFLAEFKSALELKKYLETNTADVVFLDINMPKLSGLDLLKTFKIDAFVVFTTAYPEYAVEAFEYDAVDYLLKPISFDRFLKCLEKMKAQTLVSNSSNNKNWILVKENKRLYQIALDKIQIVQAYGDYIKIICVDKNYITKERFSNFLPQLSNKFKQCHRSYSVNLDHVQYIEGNHVVVNDTKLPISNSFKEDFLKHFR